MTETASSGRVRLMSEQRSTRTAFPALSRRIGSNQLVYLDTAATALRPQSVIDSYAHFTAHHDGNPHRGPHTLSNEATIALEDGRKRIADWIGARQSESVVLTRSGTSAINAVARGLEHLLVPGDEILLTEMEHHANLVPWLMLAKRKGVVLRYLSFGPEGRLDQDELAVKIGPRTRVISVVHVSNVLGTVNPIARIASAARDAGAFCLIDAAQSVGHLDVRFDEIGADFLTFSSHKTYGPTGLGVLVGRQEALERLEPLEGGGEMIDQVRLDGFSYAPIPHRFEAGTGNAAAVAGLCAAIDFLEETGIGQIRRHESALVSYAFDRLSEIPGLHVLGPGPGEPRGALLSFELDSIHHFDLAVLLDGLGIAVRAGHHCAQPLHEKLGLSGSARASFGLYTNAADIDALTEGLLRVTRTLT